MQADQKRIARPHRRFRRRAWTSQSKESRPLQALPKSRPHAGHSSCLPTRTILPQWDCAPGVDYVTIQHRGYERKLTGGEICNPFDDVVRKVPRR